MASVGSLCPLGSLVSVRRSGGIFSLDDVWAMVGVVVGSVTMRSAIALRPATVRMTTPVRVGVAPVPRFEQPAVLLSLSEEALDHAERMPPGSDAPADWFRARARVLAAGPVRSLEARTDPVDDVQSLAVAQLDVAVSISVAAKGELAGGGYERGGTWRTQVEAQAPLSDPAPEPVELEKMTNVAQIAATMSGASPSLAGTRGRWARGVAAYVRQDTGAVRPGSGGDPARIDTVA